MRLDHLLSKELSYNKQFSRLAVLRQRTSQLEHSLSVSFDLREQSCKWYECDSLMTFALACRLCGFYMLVNIRSRRYSISSSTLILPVALFMLSFSLNVMICISTALWASVS